MLGWCLGIKRLDRIPAIRSRAVMGVGPIREKLPEREGWLGQVVRRDESHITLQAMELVEKGTKTKKKAMAEVSG